MFKKCIMIIICLMILASAAYAVKAVTYISVKNASDLQKYVGKKVVIEGKISDVPWQHIMLSSSDYPVSSYFDIGKSQIVIYSKEMIGTTKKIKVKGTVVKVSGKSKNPKYAKSKETYCEYHILVDKVEPVK